MIVSSTGRGNLVGRMKNTVLYTKEKGEVCLTTSGRREEKCNRLEHVQNYRSSCASLLPFLRTYIYTSHTHVLRVAQNNGSFHPQFRTEEAGVVVESESCGLFPSKPVFREVWRASC